MTTQTVLVTGVSRQAGIGAAVVAGLAKVGWRVFATGWRGYDQTRPWGADPLVSDDAFLPHGAVGWLDADLSLAAAAGQVFDVAEETAGPISALVNVHTYDPGGGIADIDVDEFDHHLAVNVRATYSLCREFVDRYQGDASSSGGRIVNFLSGPPLIGSVAYAASKGAAHWMTVSLAGELAPLGITVNAIDPGPTDTGWMSAELRARLRAKNPIGRISEPSDAANMVRFLLSPEGAWMTGQFIRSDGGFSQLATP